MHSDVRIICRFKKMRIYDRIYYVIIMLISHVISIINFTIFIDQHLKNYAIIDNIKMIMRILDELICGSRLIVFTDGNKSVGRFR